MSKQDLQNLSFNIETEIIYVETERGGIRVNLKDEPVAVVYVGEERVTAVYEYCNLHGLWKVEL